LFLTCREVEDFARRLNSVWNESHIGGNGSVQRFPGMFSIYNFLDEDSDTIVVIWGGRFIRDNAGLVSNIITRKQNVL